MRAGWQAVERPYSPPGTRWLHESRQVWVVHYPMAMPPIYRAYSVESWEKCPPDRDPWTVANWSVTSSGHRTLEAAQIAAEKVLT